MLEDSGLFGSVTVLSERTCTGKSESHIIPRLFETEKMAVTSLVSMYMVIFLIEAHRHIRPGDNTLVSLGPFYESLCHF